MNSNSDRLLNVLSYSWAGLLLSITGIIVALIWMSTHRKAATLVLIGMVLLLLNALRYPIVELVFAEAWRQRGIQEYVRLMRINNIIGQVMFLASGLMLLWGAFAQRSTQGPAFPIYPPRPPSYPPQPSAFPPEPPRH